MALLWQPEPLGLDDAVLIDRVAGLTYAGRQPCHPVLLDMLASISRHILHDPVSRGEPQYVALAYWLRPAALARLAEEFASDDSVGRVRVPRGIALHLPPTNVDTIFVYSWAMSVLAGNANVVRLAQQLTSNTQWLVSTVAAVVAEHGEEARQLFCHYAYGGDTEAAISRHLDLRMIWGGDAKVATVSRTPIRPDGLSLGFPDRKSLALISAQAYGDADEAARDRLVKNFFNDMFWFDQMGCGSPRLLVWLGDPGDLAADFYRRLGNVILERNYNVETGLAISKFALSNDLLAEGIANGHAAFGNALHVNRTSDPVAALARSHGGGFLCDWVAMSLDDVPPIISRQVQTITHFGLSSPEIERLACGISGRGGYRIVPTGQALQFDTTWDGVELYNHMTRYILVR